MTDDESGIDGDTLINLTLLGMGIFVLFLLALIAFFVTSGPSTTGDAPTEGWVLERVNESYVSVKYEGNGSVKAERLVAKVGTTVRPLNFPPEISRGDSTLLRAKPRKTVAIYWVGEVGGRETLVKTKVGY
ncbi:MAG: hypothetical protein SV760_08520 [Halobacteria archaeon]|nr:hypothetical protein [Halobacteria archaeon]